MPSLLLGHVKKYLSGSKTLNRPCYFCRTVRRNTLYQKMYMILVRTYLQKMDLIPVMNI